nr:MAG TPA: hypothetical protein [Caudoviricetes sp.]
MSFYLLGLTGYDGRTFCAIRYRFKACSRYLIGRDLITDHYKRKWILAPLPYLFLLILIVYASGKRVMFYEKGNTRM